MNQFAAPNYGNSSSHDIGGAELRLLQRYLQAFIVIRPRDVLQLPPCHRLAFPLQLAPGQAMPVSDLVETYKKCCEMDDQNAKASGENIDEMNALSVAIRAQLYCLHPRLAHRKSKWSSS